MLYLGKGQFQKIVRWMAGSWMSANMATAFGCVFVVLTAASFYVGLSVQPLHFLLLCVPVFLLLRMGMNALDGMLSREYNTGTVAGEVWNEALDVLGDTVCYGVLYFVDGGPRLSLVAFLLAIWAAEFFWCIGQEHAQRGTPSRNSARRKAGSGSLDEWVSVDTFFLAKHAAV